MRAGSLFSGIGGGELAAQAAGIETAWSSEIDPYPAAILKYRFPGVLNLRLAAADRELAGSRPKNFS